MDKNKFFVLLPAYNVEAHIKKTVENIKKYLDNILVVDDGSTDNTLNIIKDLRVNFLTNKKNCGKGSALSEGFKYLSAKNIDYVITMDSDGQHSPDDIPVFLKCAEAVKADIIIGNRMHDTSNMPLIRYLTNRFLSSVVSKMTKCKIPDTQCGFRMISKKVIQSVRVESRRYDAESEIIIKAGRQGFSFASVPVKTIYSTEKSRINPIIDTIRFIKLVIKLFREEKKIKKKKVYFMKFMRKLYDWVLHWAYTPYGAIVLVINSFAESSFFPVPPDVLLIALSVSRRKKALYYALITTIASVAGGILGYYIGVALWESVGKPIIAFYHAEEQFENLRQIFRDNSFIAVLVAAVTPIPYKVFTIAAGASASLFSTFMIASVIGRAARFFALGILIYFFGEKIRNFIDKYFNILSLIFIAALILGFVLIKYLLH